MGLVTGDVGGWLANNGNNWLQMLQDVGRCRKVLDILRPTLHHSASCYHLHYVT